MTKKYSWQGSGSVASQRETEGVKSFLLDCLTSRFGGKTASEEGKTEYAGEKVTTEQTLDDTLASAFFF